VLRAGELAAVAAEFGVSDAQVRRDHLISHLLAALSRDVREVVVFFGGTALSRTHLPAGRLSEDVDLLAVGARRPAAEAVQSTLADGVRREFGRLTWTPTLTAVRDTDPAVVATADGLGVRVQLLSPVGWPAWPTEERDLVQRYSDAPPARLRVPTLPAFAAMKTTAWGDRKAARDLYDLHLLAGVGGIGPAAGALYARHGPSGRPPPAWLFDAVPTAEQWQDQLGGQTRLSVGPEEAAATVRAAWARAVA
jgi:predicted nucleotidyltransferase component of viral defense system